MKTSQKTSSGAPGVTKTLTLGDLIASTYNACGDKAPKLLQLALESQIIRIRSGGLH